MSKEPVLYEDFLRERSLIPEMQLVPTSMQQYHEQGEGFRTRNVGYGETLVYWEQRSEETRAWTVGMLQADRVNASDLDVHRHREKDEERWIPENEKQACKNIKEDDCVIHKDGKKQHKYSKPVEKTQRKTLRKSGLAMHEYTMSRACGTGIEKGGKVNIWIHFKAGRE